MKIQIMGGKGVKAKHCWGMSTFFFSKVRWQCPAMFCLLPQVNFPTNNLNFDQRWRWWNRIQAIFLNLFYFILSISRSKKKKASPIGFVVRLSSLQQQLGPGLRCSGWWLTGQLNRKDRLRSLPLFRPPSFDNFYGDLQILAKKVAKKRPPPASTKIHISNT